MTAVPEAAPQAGAAGASGTAPTEPGPGADLVRIDDLSVRYRSRQGTLSRDEVEVLAVDRVSLAVRTGRTLGLVGATGSGKSTIAQVVMGMVAPTSGTVAVAGQVAGQVTTGAERLAMRRSVQVVMQDPYSSLNPRMRVRDIIAEPLSHGRFLHGRERDEVRARVSELLGLVGLKPAWADRYPHQFSGGQRQRIAIARALAPRPRLIVLDEPTSSLDVSVRAQILLLLKRLEHELGVTYLIISHDPVTVAYLASNVAVMHLGRVVEQGPTTNLYRAPRHPYTLDLVASSTGTLASRSSAIAAASRASGADATAACRYAARCSLRVRLGNPSRCVDEEPQLLSVETDHLSACHFADELKPAAVPHA